MTAVELATSRSARQRVDQIKTGVEAIWHLIVESYQARDWETLGYATWDEMCSREFGTSRLRLPREERQDVIASLRESGLSLRAIASVTGDSEPTVRRALSTAPNDAVETVVGVNGKTYRPHAVYEPPVVVLPKLTDEERQRLIAEQDRAAWLGRARDRIRAVTGGWGTVRTILADPDGVDARDIIAGLGDADRQALKEILQQIGHGT
jgi:hypothetical protein